MTKEIFEEMLGEYREVHLMVSCRPGVVLPELFTSPAWRRGEELVRLVYGLDLKIPIERWEIGEKGVGAILSFDRRPRPTYVPWDAVAIVQGRWPSEPPARPRLSLVR